MKTMLLISLLITFCSNSFAKDKVSRDGFIYHKPCFDGEFKPDTLSPHRYESKIYKGLYAAGYCVAIF